ncbi:MAG: DUF86 domain-containing protein [Spirochaetaceae bacterium]|nr:DUF86 domain-containing protein [Spirochaetaceae bacterium]
MAVNGVIQRKFALLDQHLIELRGAIEGVGREEFSANWRLRLMTERSLQVMAEILIDVAERMLALRGAGPAATAAEALTKIANLGVIRDADRYAAIVRFRNLIVHRYDEIDPAIVFDILQNHLDLFREFRDEVDHAE